MIAKKSTKELLADSALELLSQYPLEKITVADIAKNCQISTRTFYNHFHDKHELVTWIYTSKLQRYFDQRHSKISFWGFTRFSTEIVYENIDFFINVSSYQGQNCLHDSLLSPMRDMYIHIIQDIYHDPITEELYKSLTIFLYGIIGYIRQLILTRQIIPPEDASADFEEGLPGNLRKYL